MGKIAAIDFGTVRIGFALSDENRLVAFPRPFLNAGKDIKSATQNIAEELKKCGPIDSIVLGLPLHMNGKESPLSIQVRECAIQLESLLAIPVVLWDERLTTALVEKALKEGEMSRKKRKSVVDSLTAAVILQSYLESKMSISL